MSDSKEKISLEDEFSELDYDPKEKAGWLLPVLIIVVSVVIMGAIIVTLGSRQDPEIEIPSVVNGEEEVDRADEGEVEISDPEEAEETDAESESLPESEKEPPNLAVIEPVLHRWLINRTGDPQVILLHTEELNNVERFFETYDLQEDNIIVYAIDYLDDTMAGVLFGPPYSEWSILAVFIWDGRGWAFLQERKFPK
ncbi:MAG: hypothetical protein SCJ97_06630 [Bacillota bacterium]|nr:hypothetical protein [Bacillota bacterium]